jgi:adenylate cyclase class 2
MSKEFETHILNIDRKEIIRRLEALGAIKVKDVLQKRVTFDYPDRRLDAKNAFIRLRDNGAGKIELAYKCNPLSNQAGVSGSEEIEVIVSEMEKTRQLLLAIGFEAKQSIETKRISYRLDDLAFDIDEWPLLPPFVEVEGPNEQRVMDGVRLLGFDPAQTFRGDAGNMYDEKGIAWKAIKEIKF